MKNLPDQWNVEVKGLGGPHAEFNRKIFKVKSVSPALAVEKAINAFRELDKSEGERWVLAYGGGWLPYDFYSATVTKDDDVLLIDE